MGWFAGKDNLVAIAAAHQTKAGTSDELATVQKEVIEMQKMLDAAHAVSEKNQNRKKIFGVFDL